MNYIYTFEGKDNRYDFWTLFKINFIMYRVLSYYSLYGISAGASLFHGSTTSSKVYLNFFLDTPHNSCTQTK